MLLPARAPAGRSSEIHSFQTGTRLGRALALLRPPTYSPQGPAKQSPEESSFVSSYYAFGSAAFQPPPHPHPRKQRCPAQRLHQPGGHKALCGAAEGAKVN